ncbi:MAG: ATP-binding cassette domain-containing protein [Oscillospiraceae bacterium]
MLETRELCKTYRPKKGQPVMAVDHISLRFPEKGMVFLLGKSGSGKSTMLNLLGGLDQYDGGEIIIKGISSKDFTQQRFDSYRNTYVGFIFQEYNVLEEFTVGANIGLALELQGKTATDAEINAILQEVDLAGYGNRKPNELSGGQKQRVAIARALVKNPEIIMADEPTGALDSNTGRQVLDTLKRLSANKLVIIVSHDREYAEQYADRIIELADGKVIRDVEAAEDVKEEAAKQLIFRSNTVEIPAEYHLTEEDRVHINEYMDNIKKGLTLTLGGFVRKFHDTDTSAIPKQDGSKFNLIRSKLPMRSAFKIGCSSLKYKRFRLVMTILLSVAAFSLFALVDTFSSYDHIRACTQSLIDSNIDYISVCKAFKRGEGIDAWWDSWNNLLSEKDMAQLKEETGIDVMGMYMPVNHNRLAFQSQIDSEQFEHKGMYNIYPSSLHSFVEVDASSIEQMGYEVVAGSLPDGNKKELAVSLAVYETFKKGGYAAPVIKDDANDTPPTDTVIDEEKPLAPVGDEDDESDKIQYEKIEKPEDLIGKTLLLADTEYTITAVVDTKLDLNRYASLMEDSAQMSNADLILNYMLMSEYDCAMGYSLSGAAMIGKGAVAKMIEEYPQMYEETSGSFWLGTDYNQSFDYDVNFWANYHTALENIPEEDIIWLDGKKTELAKNEFIITAGGINMFNADGNAEQIVPIDDSALTADSINKVLQGMNGTFTGQVYSFSGNDASSNRDLKDMKLVGVIRPESKYSDCIVFHEDYTAIMVGDTDGIYKSAVGAMPKSEGKIEDFVRYCYREDSDVRYELQNAVTYELDSIDEVLVVLAKVFLYIGIAFAIFAALLMANFITTSISYKKQEIGILRAIGSRSNDVFRIFFSESFVIAMINFTISAILCGIGVAMINYSIRTYLGVLVTVLHFGIRQVLLLVLLSVAIAAVASFIPVYRIASKRPIDAIRNK